jgi:hypothetical protein
MFNIHLVAIMTCFTRNILLKNCELDCVVVSVIVVVVADVIVVVVVVDISVANFVLLRATRAINKIMKIDFAVAKI